ISNLVSQSSFKVVPNVNTELESYILFMTASPNDSRQNENKSCIKPVKGDHLHQCVAVHQILVQHQNPDRNKMIEPLLLELKARTIEEVFSIGAIYPFSFLTIYCNAVFTNV